MRTALMRLAPAVRHAVDAAGIEGLVQRALRRDDAAPHHGHALKNVEELHHLAGPVGGEAGVLLEEHRPHIAGGGGGVPRQADGPHALAEAGQGQARRKMVLRLAGGEVHVVGQIGLVEGEGRVVGEHPGLVLVEVQAVGGGLRHQRAGGVRHVQRGQRQPRREGDGAHGHLFQQGPGLGQTGAAAQNQPQQLVGRKVIAFGPLVGKVVGVAREIQPGHVKALLVHAFGKKRQAAGHAGHAHDGVVLRQGGAVGEGKGEGTGRDDHPLPEGYLQVQVASEKFLLKKSDAGAHGDYILFGVLSSVYTPFGPGQTKGAKKGGTAAGRPTGIQKFTPPGGR